MNSARRAFSKTLFWSLSFLTPMSLINGPWGRSVRVCFKTYFPKELSEQEYQSLKALAPGRQDRQKLLADFKEKGWIVSESCHFSPLQNEWRVTFKNQAAFKHWEQMVSKIALYHQTSPMGFSRETIVERLPS